MSGTSSLLRLVSRFIQIVLLAIYFATGAQAQVVEGGVKGGVTFATITDLEDSFTVFCIALAGVECPRVSNEGRAGATAGGFVTVRLGDTFGVQAEALFTEKGYECPVRQRHPAGESRSGPRRRGPAALP